MSRHCLLFLILVALLAAGCQNDPVGLVPNQAQTLPAPDKRPPELSGPDLVATYTASLEAEYEVFEGLYTPGTDAILGGILQTWPGICAAGINIPAGALPDSYGPVTISISVPCFRKNVPFEDQPPMVIILEPDGLRFNEPVQIMVNYPPWLEQEDQNPLFQVYCLQPVYNGSSLETVGISDFQWVNRGEPVSPPAPLIFQVPHFSRWEADQDEPGEDTEDPDDDIPPDVNIMN